MNVECLMSKENSKLKLELGNWNWIQCHARLSKSRASSLSLVLRTLDFAVYGMAL